MAALAAALPGYNIPVKDGLTHAHQAMRQDLDHLEKALTALDVREDWHVTQLCVWYSTFHDLVRRHHEVEDTIVFPWLTARAELPPSLSTDHTQLFKWMDSMNKHLQAMSMTADPRKRGLQLASTREVFQLFNPALRAHLQEEESSMPYLMRSKFTLAEYKSMMQRVLASGGLAAASTSLPWYETTMDVHERAQFEADLPAYMVLVLRKKWYPAFQRHQQLITSVYDTAVAPVHLAAPLPQCWICV